MKFNYTLNNDIKIYILCVYFHRLFPFLNGKVIVEIFNRRFNFPKKEERLLS